MKFYFVVFVFLLKISLFYSYMNPEDFCKKGSKQKCMAYQCEKQFCTLNKQTCENLKARKILIVKFVNGKKVYTNFIKSIKPCSKKKTRNQWSNRLRF